MMYALEYCALMCKFLACIKKTMLIDLLLWKCCSVCLNVVKCGLLACFFLSLCVFSHNAIRSSPSQMCTTRREQTNCFAIFMHLHSHVMCYFPQCCCYFVLETMFIQTSLFVSLKSIRISVYYAHWGYIYVHKDNNKNIALITNCESREVKQKNCVCGASVFFLSLSFDSLHS